MIFFFIYMCIHKILLAIQSNFLSCYANTIGLFTNKFKEFLNSCSEYFLLGKVFTEGLGFEWALIISMNVLTKAAVKTVATGTGNLVLFCQHSF